MANKDRGEVTLEADGTTYTLVLSVNAMCELEDMLGRSINAIAAELSEDARINTVRAILWAALQGRHPGTDIAKAGDIAGEAGLSATVEAIAEAFARGMPEAKASDPRKAAA